MAVESIGTLVPTKVPGLADPADIQAAFKAYHYGSYTFNTAETNAANLVNPSIAYTINDLQVQISAISTSGSIAVSSFNAKGDLLSASANDTLSVVSVGANGTILTANSATASGLSWASPEVGLTNTATLTNKTLTSPVITLNTTSSTTDARIAWDTTNKQIQVGNGTSLLNFQPFNVNINAKTAAYTFGLSDANTLVQMNGAFAFTVPLNSTVAYPTGTQIHLIALTTGVTVSFTGGITSYATPGAKIRAAGSMATLIKLDTNTWVLAGDLIA
jgi:hypothetical protein